MLITSPPPLFSSPSPLPDSSSNYIRQLETKVRILEDDNNKLLSQVRHTRASPSCSVGCRHVSSPSPASFELAELVQLF